MNCDPKGGESICHTVTGTSNVFSNLRGSLITAGVLLALDVLVYGSCLFSFFVGPIWLLVAIAKAIFRRNSWTLSTKRILIPMITLGIVFGNTVLQNGMARRHAEMIIKACTIYRADKGVYPTKLDELVPAYLSSVPRAKYDLFAGNFFYMIADEHLLMWVELPPFGQQVYDFEKAKWTHLD